MKSLLIPLSALLVTRFYFNHILKLYIPKEGEDIVISPRVYIVGVNYIDGNNYRVKYNDHSNLLFSRDEMVLLVA